MTGRFRVVFGNDVKQFALRTFGLNHTHDGDAPIVLQQDIRTVPMGRSPGGWRPRT
jgi:site-specific DNA-cytosine methylase